MSCLTGKTPSPARNDVLERRGGQMASHQLICSEPFLREQPGLGGRLASDGEDESNNKKETHKQSKNKTMF